MQTQTDARQASAARRRRHPSAWVSILALFATGGLVTAGWFAGSQQAQPASTSPPAAVATTTGTVPSLGGRQTTPPATRPPKARVAGTLTIRNLGTEQAPDRVYLAQGQPGTHPRIVARPGERIRIRVDNKDNVLHSLTLDQAELNLDAWAGRVSTTGAFVAPTKPGVYHYYCRYRRAGMSGTLVVSGRPVRAR